MSNEQEIKDLFEQWKNNLQRKNFEALIKNYAPDFIGFDVKENIEGPLAYKALWEKCAPYFDTPEPQYKNIKLEITDNMAAMYGLTRMTGMNLPEEMKNSPMAKSWLRLTVVYKKIDGLWKVLHEHVSYPVDCENEKPAYILDEKDVEA
ncbi:MAG: nuclear transport factor 2 family protein [Alphaproteobacteria bacterium]|nr:nuclear transport factor 2 family protein [Alphaproteobacteria bacterium]